MSSAAPGTSTTTCGAGPGPGTRRSAGGKRETYWGGASDPFIVCWPQRITARGQIRTQYAHIIDMVPTVLDLLGIQPPNTIPGVTQAPLHGVSFARTLADAAAETSRHTQYFEMLGHRAIYHDGWRAVCPWPCLSFIEAGMGFGQPISAQRLSELDATGWELYHVAEDFAEDQQRTHRKTPARRSPTITPARSSSPAPFTT